MEYRRGQTYPDDEILVGSRAKGLKIIGNSVARSVAVSFGLRLREAWLKTKPDDIGPTIAVRMSNLRPVEPAMPSIRPLLSHPKAEPIKIPDSTETSDDEDYHNHISESMLPIPNFKTFDNVVEKARSTKRPRSMSTNIQTPQESISKAPKLSGPAQIHAHSGISTMSIASSLGKSQPKLRQPISTPQLIIHGNYTASQPAETPAKTSGQSSTTSRTKSAATVVIDLTSDTEDEVSFIPAVQVSQAASMPYKAVDNSLFNAYAQTNTFMNYDVQRKHGRK